MNISELEDIRWGVEFWYSPEADRTRVRELAERHDKDVVDKTGIRDLAERCAEKGILVTETGDDSMKKYAEEARAQTLADDFDAFLFRTREQALGFIGDVLDLRCVGALCLAPFYELLPLYNQG